MTTTPVESVCCHGISVNERTQCAHYHSERDLIAIKFKCCEAFYACIRCHEELANHAPVVWPASEFQVEAIYCGNCKSTLSITEYLQCDSTCPLCQVAFNPGCANHHHLYFEQ